MCAAIGLLGMGWFKWNIVSIVALSTWTFTRWTMIAHHTCHGGYDKCHPNKGRWNRFKFAVGSFWRRLCDWFDWMMPEAWNVEHNNRHHYKLSEKEDPDLVENNMRSLRKSEMPLPLKYLKLSVLMVTWKWFYYAPNTYKELKMAKMRREGKSLPAGKWDPEDPVTFQEILSGQNPFYSMSEFFAVVAGPYFVIHFLLLPLPYLFIGRYMGLGDTLYLNALVNLFAAELLTNFHAFFAVVTNHAGDDMYRFRKSCRPFSGSFFLRQVLASAAFDMGTDPIDFFHGFLNYQVEHHLWPSLSMLSYQKAAPQVQAICAKHGVPYIKQNVFWRLKKTTDIMVGTANMKWFPLEYENKFLAIDSVAPAGTQLDSKKEE
eukprot:CAMPEP_0118713386 /NCGR_PEP_ID=MMETSP0800-20121206/25480_1 /TAXON_ID=210618 ORGANISM="Striatella unipunctata, Strain CCMP2910" /NCGR_SAMPLE_ID=MMETSP0800 /ASSEMBLY_ACC=CAM_ASM_000638 /LENGTH=373 /DNA_ID=CAMNT_0006618817 /DNA_START=283 /DNA_END=1404 /DNA_ORIENTATION=-